jgi:hypothetical protein
MLAGLQLDQGQCNIDVHLDGNEAMLQSPIVQLGFKMYIAFKFCMAYAACVARSVKGPHIQTSLNTTRY